LVTCCADKTAIARRAENRKGFFWSLGAFKEGDFGFGNRSNSEGEGRFTFALSLLAASSAVEKQA